MDRARPFPSSAAPVCKINWSDVSTFPGGRWRNDRLACSDAVSRRTVYTGARAPIRFPRRDGYADEQALRAVGRTPVSATLLHRRETSASRKKCHIAAERRLIRRRIILDPTGWLDPTPRSGRLRGNGIIYTERATLIGPHASGSDNRLVGSRVLSWPAVAAVVTVVLQIDVEGGCRRNSGGS